MTPVSFAMVFSCSFVSSFSPRSALLMSAAVTPLIFAASAVWVNPAAVRASLMSSPTFFFAAILLYLRVDLILL